MNLEGDQKKELSQKLIPVGFAWAMIVVLKLQKKLFCTELTTGLFMVGGVEGVSPGLKVRAFGEAYAICLEVSMWTIYDMWSPVEYF